MVDTVRSAQARRQLREPESGRFKDEHKKAGFPNADALEKYERQTSIVTPPRILLRRDHERRES